MESNYPKGQCRAILRYMRQGHTITGLEALNLFGCFRLPARIADLRDKGHVIERKMIKLQNGKRVAQYSLVEPSLF